jgi:Zn-dependent M28 family amino/carboxypeptidase
VDKTPGLLNKLIWQQTSDHWNFKRKNVPIVVFFTGLHPDYHTPRDTPEKIDYENLTRITQKISSALLNYSGSLPQK